MSHTRGFLSFCATHLRLLDTGAWFSQHTVGEFTVLCKLGPHVCGAPYAPWATLRNRARWAWVCTREWSGAVHTGGDFAQSRKHLSGECPWGKMASRACLELARPLFRGALGPLRRLVPWRPFARGGMVKARSIACEAGGTLCGHFVLQHTARLEYPTARKCFFLYRLPGKPHCVESSTCREKQISTVLSRKLKRMLRRCS